LRQALHIGLSRLRPGWRLRAVGGARKSAYNAGVNVKATVCMAYVTSGACRKFFKLTGC